MTNPDSLNDYLGPTRTDWVPETPPIDTSAVYPDESTKPLFLLPLTREEMCAAMEGLRDSPLIISPGSAEIVHLCPECHSENTSLVIGRDPAWRFDSPTTIVAVHCMECGAITVIYNENPHDQEPPMLHLNPEASAKLEAAQRAGQPMPTEESLIPPASASVFADFAGSRAFYDLLWEAACTHDRKQRDYCGGGDPFANFKGSADFAGCSVAQAIRLHIGNKYERIRNLEKQAATSATFSALHGHPVALNEPTLDSYLDLAVYCLLYLAWMRSQHED